MADPVFLDVAVDGGSLTVARWGDGGEDVVLGLHGITASSISLAPLATAVAPRTVLAPDLRGRGASAGLPGPFGMAAHARDCAAVIRELAGGAAVTVVGESMGAFVAVVLAAEHPDLVRKLVLVDGGLPLPLPADLDPDTVADALLGPALERLRMTFPSVEAYFDFWRVHPALGEAWNDAVEAYLRYDLTGVEPSLRSKVSEEAVRGDARDTIVNVASIEDALRRLRCPVHLLRATRNLANAEPPLLPDEAVAPWRSALPQLVDEVVPDTNHYSIIFGERGRAAVALAVSG